MAVIKVGLDRKGLEIEKIDLGKQSIEIGNSIFRKIFRTDCRKKVLTKSYRAISNFIIDALIVAVLFSLLLGTVQIFIRLPAALTQDFFSQVFHNLLNDVMVVFIFVELFRVLLDYFKEERVKITYIADATLVFTFKEIWVRLSEPDIDSMKIIAMGVTILVIAAVRTLAIYYSPERVKE